MKRMIVLLFAPTMLITACAANADREDTGEQSEAYGESACNSNTADKTETYSLALSTCNKLFDYSPNGSYGTTSCTHTYISDQPVTGTGDIHIGVSIASTSFSATATTCPYYCVQYKALAEGQTSHHQPVTYTIETGKVIAGSWNGSACTFGTQAEYGTDYNVNVPNPYMIRLEAQAFYSATTGCTAPVTYYPVTYMMGENCP